MKEHSRIVALTIVACACIASALIEFNAAETPSQPPTMHMERRGSELWLVISNNSSQWVLDYQDSIGVWHPYLQQFSLDPIRSIDVKLNQTNDMQLWRLRGLQ